MLNRGAALLRSMTAVTTKDELRRPGGSYCAQPTRAQGSFVVPIRWAAQ